MAYGQVIADSMQTSSGSILGAGNATAFKNRLIDAGFIINQRGYTSGTSLSSGSYGHDRWKGGGSGGTYTFTQGSLGVPISITITAGSIQQVIEGCNMPEGGTYVLSWTGTAQARFNGGTYGSSPLAVTGITAGANTTIEFNTGTLSYPQLEVGSTATSFDYRPYGTELNLCYRYYYKTKPNGGANPFQGAGIAYSVNNFRFNMAFPVTMRTAPTALEQSGTAGDYSVLSGSGWVVSTSVPTLSTTTNSSLNITFTTTAGFVIGYGGIARDETGNAYFGWSAEL